MLDVLGSHKECPKTGTMTSFAGDNMRVLYPDIEPYEHGNWSFASLELELSTAVRLSEPPNINMLDSDLDLERCASARPPLA